MWAVWWIGHSAFSAVVAGSNPSGSGEICNHFWSSFFHLCDNAAVVSSRVLPFPLPIKKLQWSNSTLVTSCEGRLSTHLLSHYRADVAESWSALTSHRLNTRALVKIQHLFFFCRHKSDCRPLFCIENVEAERKALT